MPNAAGLYAVEVPAVLVTANLEYYLEAWDKLGNGPSRNGNPEHPHVVKLERPKPRVVEKKEEKKPGAPPAVSHIPVQKATKGRSIPLEALFASQTGLSRPTVEFRRQGAPAFTALPMVDAGGNKYLAEIPAAFVTGDLEYYVEAFDANGNGPGRSGDPTLPYRITVEDEVAAPPPTPMVGAQVQPQYYAPPPPRPPRVHGFKPFAGEAASWILMTGGVAAAVFAGGDALGGSLAHDLYTHKLSYEHIADTAMLEHANAFASHATILAGVSAGCFLVGGVMLGIIETARDKEDARQADADAAEDAAAAVKAIQQQQGRPR